MWRKSGSRGKYGPHAPKSLNQGPSRVSSPVAYQNVLNFVSWGSQPQVREEPDMTKSIHSGDGCLRTSQTGWGHPTPLVLKHEDILDYDLLSIKVYWQGKKKLLPLQILAFWSQQSPISQCECIHNHSDLYSWFSLLTGVLLYKVSSNTYLANAKSLLLEKIQD